MTAPASRPPAALDRSAARCPTCSHESGTERLDRGWWPWGRKLLRCCHVTDNGPDSIITDDVEVCECADSWHTVGR